MLLKTIYKTLKYGGYIKVVYHNKISKSPVFIRTEKYIAYTLIKKVLLFF